MYFHQTYLKRFLKYSNSERFGDTQTSHVIFTLRHNFSNCFSNMVVND